MVTRGSDTESGSRWERARQRVAARNEAGISMIELIVAVVIITIVLLSGTTAIDFSLTASNMQRLKVEASDLALSSIEQDEQLASSLAIGQSATTTTINTTTFTITTTVTDLDQNGSQLTTVCTSSSPSVAQQIWQIAVAVTWAHMNGAPAVTQTTEVAPGQVDAVDLAYGEIAVPVTGANGLPIATPVNFTVTPNYIPGGAAAYPTPSGQTDPAGITFNTGANGCGVVTGLSPSPQWNYIVTLSGNPGLVSSTELSDVNPAGDPTQTLSAPAGQVTRVSPAFQLATGITTTITLQPVNFACAGGSPVPACYVAAGKANYAVPLATLPVTFGNSSLPASQYTFGSGTTTISSELVYPYSSYDVWSGDMAQSSPGATVTGLGTFLYAGPGTTDDTPAPIVLSFTGSGTTASVTVPTYDLSIQVASSCAGDNLLATEESGGGYAYGLNAATGSGNPVSATGMPLGQYLLSGTGGSCPALTSAKGLYVWVTPTGVYESPTIMTTPYTGTAVSTSSNVQVTE
ncbi:MAG: hypothetical protein ABSH30_15400 [Acidimicrobiales bacterium]|jgi:type II secretory pathway pseudopilin PulG